MQTSRGIASFDVEDAFDRGGSNFTIFDVPSEHQAFVSGIVEGERFIFALARTSLATSLQGVIASGIPELSGVLSVNNCSICKFGGLINSGSPILSGTLSITLPGSVSLSGDSSLR